VWPDLYEAQLLFLHGPQAAKSDARLHDQSIPVYVATYEPSSVRPGQTKNKRNLLFNSRLKSFFFSDMQRHAEQPPEIQESVKKITGA
jgi:hypothetical protein